MGIEPHTNLKNSAPIVVGYVPNDEGRAAFAAAIVEARKSDTHLLLVNSAHGGSYTDSQLATEHELQDLVDQGTASGIHVEVRQLPHGADPTDSVLDAIEETGAQMLVIGMRRRSPVGKLFLGSTAQTLLLHSPVPVLSVKADPSNNRRDSDTARTTSKDQP